MNDIKTNKIWEEINAVIREHRGERLPDEKTVNELAEEWGMNIDRVRKITDTLVGKGLLLKRKIGSNKMYLFRPNPSIENFDVVLRDIFNL